MATDAENLAAVKTAINNVLTYGEYVAADGHTWKASDLDALSRLQATLEAKINAASAGGILRSFSAVVQR